jgi:hypothetical protein
MMIAKIMNGKDSELYKVLEQLEEPINRRNHLCSFRNQLKLTKVVVETPDGEEYTLPIGLVYIFKPKNKNGKDTHSFRH